MVKWVAVGLLAAACGAPPPPELALSEARAPASTDTLTASAYFTIAGGDVADTLTGVTASIARSAMVHLSERADGLRRMRHVPSLPIAPGATVRLAPGGYHVMLEHLSRRPEPGDTILLTLTFRHAGVRRLAVPVVRYEDLQP